MTAFIYHRLLVERLGSPPYTNFSVNLAIISISMLQVPTDSFYFVLVA